MQNSTVLQYPMHNEEAHGARTQFFALRAGNYNNTVKLIKRLLQCGSKVAVHNRAKTNKMLSI